MDPIMETKPNQTSLLDMVMLDKDGKLIHGVDMNTYTVIVHCCCILIGIPLNVFIALAIVCVPRLRSKPRNMFLLAMVCANLSTYIPVMAEVLNYLTNTNDSCLLYVATSGLPYTCFLFNLLMALIDRYVAIVHPLWHHRKMSSRCVIFWLFFFDLLLCVLMKLVFIAQLMPLQCEIRILHSKVVSVTVCVLFLLCLLAQIVVYLRTRELINANRTDLSNHPSPRGTLPVDGIFDRPIAPNEELISLRELTPSVTAVPGQRDRQQTSRMNVHVSNNKLNSLEVEATKTLIGGVTSLIIMMCPIMIVILAYYSCVALYSAKECSSFTYFRPVFKELPILHTVYHPLMYLVRSSEFWTAWKIRFDQAVA